MEDFITRPIGEKFDYEGDMLEVVEKESTICNGCYFSNIICCRFEEILDITGYCGSSQREDKTEVIFKEVQP